MCKPRRKVFTDDENDEDPIEAESENNKTYFNIVALTLLVKNEKRRFD